MIDPTETAVLPENELAKGQQNARPEERDDGADTAFDKTLVLEDEVAKRRRLRWRRGFQR